MTNFETLLSKVEESDIIFINSDSEIQPAKTMHLGDDCAIFLNESAFETDAVRFTVLAHEKGHCDSGAFYSAHTPLITREWCENRAWRRAVLDNLPYEKLTDAISACRTEDGIDIISLAEHLSMTPDFVLRAIGVYGRLGKEVL